MSYFFFSEKANFLYQCFMLNCVVFIHTLMQMWFDQLFATGKHFLVLSNVLENSSGKFKPLKRSCWIILAQTSNCKEVFAIGVEQWLWQNCNSRLLMGLSLRLPDRNIGIEIIGIIDQTIYSHQSAKWMARQNIVWGGMTGPSNHTENQVTPKPASTLKLNFCYPGILMMMLAPSR